MKEVLVLLCVFCITQAYKPGRVTTKFPVSNETTTWGWEVNRTSWGWVRREEDWMAQDSLKCTKDTMYNHTYDNGNWRQYCDIANVTTKDLGGEKYACYMYPEGDIRTSLMLHINGTSTLEIQNKTS